MNDNTINNDMTMGGATGTLLAGRYRVVRQLGQGGMGSVWLAEDLKLDGFKVAIKMLPSVLVNNKRAYAQVKAEALVSLKLSHPNIVTVRAFEEEGGNPFLVMDYIDGQTLDDYLAEKGKLTEEETVRLLKPVAAALDYAHTQGVVHRDVKPGNIMIRKDGTPFVLDFGIAREIQETMTRVTGKLSSGTLLYMSPEQLNGDAPKPAQDIYSFAAMAYECLKGEPPFVRGQIEEQIRRKIPASVPKTIGIGAAVMSGLAKEPSRRSRCCAAVLTSTVKLHNDGGVGVGVVIVAFAGAILLGLGLVFAWSAYERHAESVKSAQRKEKERVKALQSLAREDQARVDVVCRTSERKKYSEQPGLVEKAGELCRLRSLGRAALVREDWMSATNHFRMAMDCADWLVSNSVLSANCVRAMKVAQSRRAEAEKADAPNLASNAYAQACQSYVAAEDELSHAEFIAAQSAFENLAEDFAAAKDMALQERERLDCEAREKAVAEGNRKKAVAEMDRLAKTDEADGFGAKIKEAGQMLEKANVEYANGQWSEAAEGYTELKEVCQRLQQLDEQRKTARGAAEEAGAALSKVKAERVEECFAARSFYEEGLGELKNADALRKKMSFNQAKDGYLQAKRSFMMASQKLEEANGAELESLMSRIGQARSRCEEARLAAIRAEAPQFARDQWQGAELEFNAMESVPKMERESKYESLQKRYEGTANLAKENARPRVWLTASLRGKEKPATVVAGIVQKGEKTPMTISVGQELGVEFVFEAKYFDDGVPYRGKAVYRTCKGLTPVNIILTDDGLWNRPSGMNYCGKCGGDLTAYRKLGECCPRCGSALNWAKYRR